VTPLTKRAAVVVHRSRPVPPGGVAVVLCCGGTKLRGLVKTFCGASGESRRLRPSVHPSSLIPHPLKIAAHGVESGPDGLDGGGEGEAQVALAVLAEDYAGDCCDLRAFEKEVGGGAAVR